MKRLFLIITFIAFYINANSQSLTFKDLLNLANQASSKPFLTPRKFILENEDNRVEQYIKNKGTDSCETVTFYKPGGHGARCSYWSADSAYVHTILIQIQKQYHLIFKDFGPGENYYQFGDEHMDIRVDMEKKSPGSGHVSVGKK